MTVAFTDSYVEGAGSFSERCPVSVGGRNESLLLPLRRLLRGSIPFRPTRVMLFPAHPLRVFLAIGATFLTVAACSSDSDDNDDDGSGTAGRSGGSAGAPLSTGAAAGTNSGGRPGAGAPSAGSSGAGTQNGGGRTSRGGSPGSAGSEDAPGMAGRDDEAGASGAHAVPSPSEDGSSPYLRECHGDSLDCADPSMRCLGIREGTEVFGYGCSNTCNGIDDCSRVESGAAAAVDCVEFVTSKHCLFVCKDEQNGERACPDGMSCYVYPGSPTGYCLWRP